MKGTTFGRKLRKLRKAAGLSQAELAKRAGCNPVSISQYEAGVYEPRDERATMLIELVRGGSHPPEELKAAAPKKRGRPKKDPAAVAKPKRGRKRLALKNALNQDLEPPEHPNCRSHVQPVEPEDGPPKRRREEMDSAGKATPVRLGSVSRAWVEQMTDAHVHARGAVIVEGPVRVCVLRRADLVGLVENVLGAVGTKVAG